MRLHVMAGRSVRLLLAMMSLVSLLPTCKAQSYRFSHIRW